MTNKYGRVSSELKELPHDEPMFILRGKDVFAPLAVEAYAQLLRSAAIGAAPPRLTRASFVPAHLEKMAHDVSNVAATMIAWQSENADRIRLPD